MIKSKLGKLKFSEKQKLSISLFFFLALIYVLIPSNFFSDIRGSGYFRVNEVDMGWEGGVQTEIEQFRNRRSKQ